MPLIETKSSGIAIPSFSGPDGIHLELAAPLT